MTRSQFVGWGALLVLATSANCIGNAPELPDRDSGSGDTSTPDVTLAETLDETNAPSRVDGGGQDRTIGGEFDGADEAEGTLDAGPAHPPPDASSDGDATTDPDGGADDGAETGTVPGADAGSAFDDASLEAEADTVAEAGDAPPPLDSDPREATVADTATPTPCDPAMPFEAVENVAELNTAGNDEGARLLPDQRTVFFTRQTDQGPFGVFRATRNDARAPFGLAVRVELPADSSGATLTSGGTLMVFSSDLGMDDGDPDLYVSPYPPNQSHRPLEGLNKKTSWEYAPHLSPDGRELFYVTRSSEEAHDDIMVSVDEGAGFSSATPVSELNTPANERSPVVSADGLRLYFASNRSGQNGLEIYVASRTTRTGRFGEPILVQGVNTTSNDNPDWISEDECTLYFRSTRPDGKGGRDVWRATRRR